MPDQVNQIDDIMQSVKAEADKITAETVQKQTTQEFADIRSNLEAVKELENDLPKIHAQIKGLNDEWLKNFKTVEEVTETLDKIPTVIAQAKTVQTAQNISLKDSISLMMKELDLIEQKNKSQQQAYTILQSMQANVAKGEEKILDKLNAKVAAKKKEIIEIEKANKLSLSGMARESIFKKGSIAGSIIGNVDQKSIMSKMIYTVMSGTTLQKTMQSMSGMDPSGKRKELKALQEISDSTRKSLGVESESTKIQNENLKETTKASRLKAVGWGAAAVAVAGGAKAADVGLTVASQIAKGFQTAWSGPAGLLHAMTDPLTKGLSKIAPKTGAALGTLLDVAIQGIMFKTETGIITAQTQMTAARQGGRGAGLSALGQGGLLTRGEYASVVNQAIGAGLDVTNTRVGQFAGYQRLYGEGFLNNISALNTGLGDTEEATKRSVDLFETLRRSVKGTGISAESMAQTTAQAAQNARFLNVDYRLVRETMKALVTDSKSLASLGVDIKGRGGEILGGIVGARKSMTLAAAMYYGTQIDKTATAQEAATMMRFGDKNAFKISKEGRLTSGISDKVLAERATGLTVATVKGLQDTAGKLAASGMEGATLLEMLSNTELGQGLNQEQLTAALRLDPDQLNAGMLDALNKSWKTPEEALRETASIAAKTEKVQESIANIIFSILGAVIVLPKQVADAFGMLKEEESKKLAQYNADVAATLKSSFKYLASVPGGLSTGGMLSRSIDLYNQPAESRVDEANRVKREIINDPNSGKLYKAAALFNQFLLDPSAIKELINYSDTAAKANNTPPNYAAKSMYRIKSFITETLNTTYPTLDSIFTGNFLGGNKPSHVFDTITASGSASGLNSTISTNKGLGNQQVIINFNSPVVTSKDAREFGQILGESVKFF